MLSCHCSHLCVIPRAKVGRTLRFVRANNVHYVVHRYRPQPKETPTKPLPSSTSCSSQGQRDRTSTRTTVSTSTGLTVLSGGGLPSVSIEPSRQRTCDSHVYPQGNNGAGGVEKYEGGLRQAAAEELRMSPQGSLWGWRNRLRSQRMM